LNNRESAIILNVTTASASNSNWNWVLVPHRVTHTIK